jgi:hypothetical protein
LIALDLWRRPVLVEQSGEDRRERVTGLNRFEIPGAIGMDLIGSRREWSARWITFGLDLI